MWLYYNKLRFNDDDQLHQIAVACGMRSEIDELKVSVCVCVKIYVCVFFMDNLILEQQKSKRFSPAPAPKTKTKQAAEETLPM